MTQKRLWFTTAVLAFTCSLCFYTCIHKSDDKPTLPPTEDSSQFVTLTDVVPDAILEIRYFGTYNFVGQRIDGYEEPTALLTKQAADSLRAVSDDVINLRRLPSTKRGGSFRALGCRHPRHPHEVLLLSRP